MRKIKNNKLAFIASIFLTFTPMAVGFILWNRLPDRIATHFDFNGVPDGYTSKWFAVVGISLILLAFQLIVSIATASEDDKGNGIPENLYRVILWIVPVISVIVASLIYTTALSTR